MAGVTTAGGKTNFHAIPNKPKDRNLYKHLEEAVYFSLFKFSKAYPNITQIIWAHNTFLKLFPQSLQFWPSLLNIPIKLGAKSALGSISSFFDAYWVARAVCWELSLAKLNSFIWSPYYWSGLAQTLNFGISARPVLQ